MCASRNRSTGIRGPCSQTLVLLLPLSFLFSLPRFAQGSIYIPRDLSEPPLLKEMPVSFTAFSQEDIELPCEATGNPTPIFRWVKDGEPFNTEPLVSGTLKAETNDSLETYQGSWRCYASNILGTAVTQTVHVIVERPPVLQKQQKVHKKVHEGESLILSCNPPESSMPPNIHWMDKKMVHIKQSERVLVGLDGNLYFSNLLKSDSRGEYICNAQYPAAMTVLPETAVTLSVLPSNAVPQTKKPHLLRPNGTHSTVLALKGDSLTLECIPKGIPTPKVEWKKKDGKLEESSGESSNFGRWLFFDNITQRDDGEYECRAYNVHGSTTHSFTVTVEAAPYWVKEPKSLLYAPQEYVRLDCQAEGIPTPTITWSINGQPLTEVDKDPRRNVLGGVLKLINVEVADTAVYQCEATNKHGSILLNTYINVVMLPPQILTSDGLVYKVTEGGNIFLHCESFGSPQPHVTWEDKNRTSLLSHPRVSLLANGTVEMVNISHSDTGNYTCTVKDNNISIVASLKVYDRTVISMKPQHVRALRGTTALLNCNSSVDPKMAGGRQIVWRKDGLKIQESFLDDKYTMFENGTLRVVNIQSNDNGIFTCEVITDLDHVQASGSITVVAPPDPPKDLDLSEVDAHSLNLTLTLSWTPGLAHNSPIIEYIVEAREEQHTEEVKWRWEEWKRVPGDFNEIELKLHPYCTYRFRVIAVNDLGHSEPSKPSDYYSTPPAVPNSNPTAVRSDSKEPGTLIVTWDEMEKRFHSGQGFQYKVSWREASGKGVHWNTGYVKSPPFIVNNTGTYTPFEIKVRAVNSLGEGPSPDAEIGHSGEDVPLDFPSEVVVTVINSTAKVKWNEPKIVRGLLLGYKIYIKRLGPKAKRRRRSLGEKHYEVEAVGQKQPEEEVVVVNGMKTSEEISGLKLYSLYELSITVFNSKGQGPRSPVHRFETPEGAPGPPASLTFESPTAESLILYWTPPTETNGVLLGYTVQHQHVNTKRSHVLSFSNDVTDIKLDHLDPNSYYIFNVMAHTAAGDGPPITRRNATLLDGVPPSNITMFFGDTYVNLSWVPGERNRNLGFQINYLRKSAGGTWQESEVINSTQGFYSLTGLQPGTTYHFKIRHGNNTQWEDVVQTEGPELSEMPSGFATQGWFIGLISAIVLLVLILLILCLIKRRKGGKYAVKDKEAKEVDSEARPMKDETFGEYSDVDEKRSDSQPSLCESKMGSDDSLAEYGDSVDIQFNEDGSFIGQYSGRVPVPHGNESSGPASPVNAVPPPPIAPSMSTVLDRPS